MMNDGQQLNQKRIPRRTLLKSTLVAPALIGTSSTPIRAQIQKIRPAAPFRMDAISFPDFSAARRFLVSDFGAVEGDKRRTSEAIAHAITAASAAGNGRIVIPAGTWLTGRIQLKSNVNLHLESGATLIFSSLPDNCLPSVSATREGFDCYTDAPLVHAHGCENIAITGKGLMLAESDGWTDDIAGRRQPFIHFKRCSGMLIEDITVHAGSLRTIRSQMCNDLVIRRVDIQATGHDSESIAAEMSQNILVEDGVFEQGHDAISIKSEREVDDWRAGCATRNIVIRNCRIKNGHHLLAIGSDVSAGVENIFVDNCHFERGTSNTSTESNTTGEINHLVHIKTDGRRGGLVQNIHVNNLSAPRIAGGAICVETDVPDQRPDPLTTHEARPTPIQGLYLSHVRIGAAGFVCRIDARAGLFVKDVTLRQIHVASVRQAAVALENVTDFYAHEVHVESYAA